jgi:hypothetical protein
MKKTPKVFVVIGFFSDVFWVLLVVDAMQSGVSRDWCGACLPLVLLASSFRLYARCVVAALIPRREDGRDGGERCQT